MAAETRTDATTWAERAAQVGRRNRFPVVTFIVGLVFVFGPLAAGLLGLRPETIDNRPLIAAPQADHGWKALDELGPWATDHLPGRAQAVRLKAQVDYYGYGDLPGQRVVRGKDGHLFLTDEFVGACRSDSVYATRVARILRFAHLLERSGRKVVVTIAPDKGLVATDKLPSAVPKGRCALDGLRTQQQVLDAVTDPVFIPVRAEMQADFAKGEAVSWKGDTHWTSLGATTFARQLAQRLDPSMAGRLSFDAQPHTRVPDLMQLMGLSKRETQTMLTANTGGEATASADSGKYDPDHPYIDPLSWTTSPSAGLIPGRTVLLGDSYTYNTIDVFRPMFAQGRYLWVVNQPRPVVAQAIKDADTIVIEIASRTVPSSPFADPKFYSDVSWLLQTR